MSKKLSSIERARIAIVRAKDTSLGNNPVSHAFHELLLAIEHERNVRIVTTYLSAIAFAVIVATLVLTRRQ